MKILYELNSWLTPKRMFALILLVLAFLLLAALLSGTSVSVTARPAAALQVDRGVLLDSYAFADGGSLTISYTYDGARGWISFAYAYRGSVQKLGRYEIPDNLGLPDRAQARLCGKYVYLFAAWVAGFEPGQGPVYQFDFPLDRTTGLCELEKLR